jgi:hypothetical protein
VERRHARTLTGPGATGGAIRRRGPPAAYHLSHEAVGLAEDTDELLMHGHVLMALAEVLRLGGRDADAMPVLGRRSK